MKLALSLAIIMLVLIIIWQSRCNGNKQPVDNSLQLKYDSLYGEFIDANNSTLTERKEAHRQLDSVIADNEALREQKNIATARVESRGKIIVDLNTQYKSAKALNDTLGQLVKCDSISSQYDALVPLYFEARDKNDSLISHIDQLNLMYAGELARCEITNDRNVEMIKGLNQIHASIMSSLPPVYHRLSVGPGIGVTWINGKFQPVVQFGINYDLFRFKK